MLFFRRRIVNDPSENVADKIKKELVNTFQQKGIETSKLIIDMKSNKLNVEVCIKGQ